MSTQETSVVHLHKVIDVDTGKVVSENLYQGRSQNGKDWWIMYRLTMAFIATGKLTYSAVRTYMYLTANADWRGFCATTRTAIAKEIGLSTTAVSEGLKELMSFDMIRETKERGLPVFTINPTYMTLGKDKKTRTETYKTLPSKYVHMDICDYVSQTF